MKTIYKYQLQFLDRQVVEVPLSGTVKLLWDERGIFLWCMAETEAPTSCIVITICGTGQLLPDDCGDWIGTFREAGYVWHVFARVLP